MRISLVTLVGAAAVAAAAPNAHAMGVYISFDIVAFGDDGNSVLVHRYQSSSAEAGRTETYLLITAASSKVEDASFDDTRDPDTTTQHVSAAACEKAATSFAKKIADAGIQGVSLDAKACKSSRRVVSVDKSVAIVVPPDTTEERKFFSGPGNDGKLLVELWGGNGDDSVPGHARVYVASGTGFKLLVDDMR